MLASEMPTFARWVGVAPSTTTMQLGAHEALAAAMQSLPAVAQHVDRQRAANNTPVAPNSRRYYMPYNNLEDLKAAGLGIVNESDAWLTGRPYGLPGTATVRLSQRQGGYHDPNGYHYNASMVGGGFGDADTQALTVQVQQLAAVQQAQADSLKRIAFWQAVVGGLTIASVVGAVAVGVAKAVRSR